MLCRTCSLSSLVEVQLYGGLRYYLCWLLYIHTFTNSCAHEICVGACFAVVVVALYGTVVIGTMVALIEVWLRWLRCCCLAVIFCCLIAFFIPAGRRTCSARCLRFFLVLAI